MPLNFCYPNETPKSWNLRPHQRGHAFQQKTTTNIIVSFGGSNLQIMCALDAFGDTLPTIATLMFALPIIAVFMSALPIIAVLLKFIIETTMNNAHLNATMQKEKTMQKQTLAYHVKLGFGLLKKKTSKTLVDVGQKNILDLSYHFEYYKAILFPSIHSNLTNHLNVFQICWTQWWFYKIQQSPLKIIGQNFAQKSYDFEDFSQDSKMHFLFLGRKTFETSPFFVCNLSLESSSQTPRHGIWCQIQLQEE